MSGFVRIYPYVSPHSPANPTKSDIRGQNMRIVAYAAIALVLLVTGIWVGMAAERSNPACHSVQEDSVILDCDYHNGAWYRK
jgi:hypothetical protein